jgi:uncharacterized protein
MLHERTEAVASPIDLTAGRAVLRATAGRAGSLDEKLEHLRASLRDLDSLVVCFSGGVDSALLLKVAYDVLGARCVALTAVSPSLPERERRQTRAIASEIGVVHHLRESAEIEDPDYLSNPEKRCYYCKRATFDVTDALVAEIGFAHVAIGTNLDDLGEHRPGQEAGRQRNVLQPLVDAGFRKVDVRQAAKSLGLSVWDKPEAACLSSRVPYGTQITVERLGRIESCEDTLLSLGFRVFRVRYHDDVARIELGVDELQRAFEPQVAPKILSGFKAAGFKYVSVDLEGYRRGSMNE